MGKQRPLQILIGKQKPTVTNYLISGRATYSAPHRGLVGDRSVRGQTREEVLRDAFQRAPEGTLLNHICTDHHGTWRASTQQWSTLATAPSRS